MVVGGGYLCDGDKFDGTHEGKILIRRLRLLGECPVLSKGCIVTGSQLHNE